MDRQAGGGTLGHEWDAVLQALRSHPDADPEDRPPTRRTPGHLSLPTTFSTSPKRHRDPEFLAAKRARLWEEPAALGSGMLSADNDDETAKNVWRAYEASGMPRTHGLHWNAVPWYVGDGRRNAPVTTADVERGRSHLVRLLDLAPAIAVVVALGRKARQSIAGAQAELAARGIQLITAPHPSPIPANRSRGRSLSEINAAFADAMRIVGRG